MIRRTKASESSSTTGPLEWPAASCGRGPGESTGTSGVSVTTADSDGETSAGTTVSASAGESSEGGASETGALEGCAAATDADACAGLGGCGWVQTSVVDMICGDLGFEEGYCLEVDEQNPNCGNFIPTCPNGTAVLYQELVLEVGAVELLVVDGESLCEIPAGFAACQFNSDPKPGSEPSYFPEACICACE